MRALRFHGPRDFRLEDVDDPFVTPGTVLLRVSWIGICGTDLHEYTSGPVYVPAEAVPLTLGHEFTAEVAEVGEGVARVAPGDRVAVDSMSRCNSCWYCERGMYHLCDNLQVIGLSRDGAMAEYVVVPESCVHRLPDQISDEEGVLVEILACGIHTARRGRVMPGDSVAVIGAGPMGLMTLAACVAAGAEPAIAVERAAARQERARSLGASHVVDPGDGDPVQQVRELTEGRGVDVSFECVGVQNTLEIAVRASRKRGRVVVTGVFEEPSALQFNEIVLSERELIGSVSYQFDHPRTIELMASGKIDVASMITGKVDLADTAEGFERLVNAKDENVKILINPR